MVNRSTNPAAGAAQHVVAALVLATALASSASAELPRPGGEHLCQPGTDWPEHTDDRAQAAALEVFAQDGNAAAQFHLAAFHILDDPELYDPIAHIYWLMSSAQGGCSLAQNDLGVRFIDDEVIRADYTQAYWWFNQAYANGFEASAEALFSIERQPMYQRDMSRNTREMVDWYRGQAAAGNPWAAYRSAQLSSSAEESMRWLEQSADAGNSMARMSLGGLYSGYLSSTAFEIEPDRERAVGYYLPVAETGDEWAMYRLAFTYFEIAEAAGETDSTEMREAERWFRMCAEAGDYSCQSAMAMFYSRGLGGLEQDEALVEYWQNLSEANNPIIVSRTEQDAAGD